MKNNTYWMVVWNQKNGDFKNAKNNSQSENKEKVIEAFENEHPGYLVIHIGKGEIPPKTYRSLKYVN